VTIRALPSTHLAIHITSVQANMRRSSPSRPVAGRSRRRPNLSARFAVTDLDELFKGFADPTRLRILNALAAGELCVCDLIDLLALAQSLISRHLAYLRRAGLVEVTRASKYAYYRLAEPSNPVHRSLINCVRSCFVGIESLDRERRRAEARVREREESPCD
jgi:ArsR family transcriptional regulator, arsenate/arsenite/antimonite-responsive transcriptional repressor